MLFMVSLDLVSLEVRSNERNAMPLGEALQAVTNILVPVLSRTV
jgi:hypothetical protein